MVTSNIIHRYDDILRLREGKKVYPHFVTMQTCSVCNQKCAGCAYSGQHNGQILSLTDHITAIDKLMKVGVKSFEFCGGGEPSLIPGLHRIIAYIGVNGGHVGLMTNGVSLTPEVIQAMCLWGTYIRFSLEASSEDDYLAYKNSNAWQSVLATVENTLRARFETSNCLLQVGLKFAVGKSLRGSEHYMNALELAAIYNGVDRVTFNLLTNCDEELCQGDIIKEAALLGIAIGKYKETWAFEVVDNVRHLYDSMIPQCYLNPLHTVIDETGDMYICCYYNYRQEKHRVGNIIHDDFEKIWMSEEHLAKIASIDRSECAKVRCKFFDHHKAVKDFELNGRGFFL